MYVHVCVYDKLLFSLGLPRAFAHSLRLPNAFAHSGAEPGKMWLLANLHTILLAKLYTIQSPSQSIL